MQVENLSPIERELWWKEGCRRAGVRMILTDADDTLWRTIPIFRRYFDQFVGYLDSVCPNPNWRGIVDTINNGLYEKYGVEIARWGLFEEELVRSTGINPEWAKESVRMALEIYKTPPETNQGTVDFLEFCQRVGTPVGLVTHADPEWTRFKLESTGLEKFFPWDRVYIVDPKGHKTRESWQEAMKYFGVTPRQCLIMGDSARADINPCQQLGVLPKNTMMIRGVNTWSLHQQLVDPETVMVDNPGQMIGAVISKAWDNFRPRSTF